MARDYRYQHQRRAFGDRREDYRQRAPSYGRGGFVGERFRGYGEPPNWYWHEGHPQAGYFGTGAPPAPGMTTEGTSAGTRVVGPSGYLSFGEPDLPYGPEPYGTAPSFRGRGPKGYRRSDERLQELICERLTDDPYIDATDISVDVDDQVVVLTGTVDSRSTKYRIEELVERCGGIRDVDNRLHARSDRPGTSPHTSGGTIMGTNKDTVKGSFKQIKGRIKEQWGKLTDDEIDQIEGRTEVLAGKLQERYGLEREEAERQVREFSTRHGWH